MNNFKLLFISIFLYSSFPLNAQTIEWTYEVEASVNTIPQYFWVDEQGNGFYNIREENPNRPGDANYGSFLLMLDKNGKFKRTTRINNCDKTVQLLPFGENQLISSGMVCLGDSISKNTQLFDYSGSRKKVGNSHFPGNYFASISVGGEFTFFSKPIIGYGYTYISIGKIDKNLKTSNIKVPLDKIAHPDYGIINTYVDPALTANGTWVVPMQYGETGASLLSITPKHGIAMGIKKDKIIWQYPTENNLGIVNGVCAAGKKVGVLFSSKKNKFPFVILDQNGNVLKMLNLPTGGRGIVNGVKMTEEEIFVITSKNLLRYDMEGNLMDNLRFSEMEFVHGGKMQLLEDGAVIFVARHHGNAVICKVSFDDKEAELEKEIESLEATILEEQQQETKPQISFSSIDKGFDKSIISATVYPNPTADFINFKFEGDIEENESLIIQISDSSGKLMFTKNTTESGHPIDVQSLVGGTYIYRITTKKAKKLMSGKFVKVE